MKFSVGILGLLALTPALASPGEASSGLQARDGHDFRWLSKRCCINCMNPCSNCSGKGPGGSTCHSSKRSEGVSQWPSKRCCILCDNPYARCGAKDKREAVDRLEDALFVKAIWFGY
ncbi:hypothetical protein FALBO_16972, partial [Fusarium albosuccineum]